MAADEVGTARTIGSLIGKSTGGISGTLNKAAKKKGKANKAAKGSKPEVLTGTVIEPDPVSPVAKEPEIYDAEIVSPKEITRGPLALPGGRRWEEFKTYVEKTRHLPAVNLDEFNKQAKMPKKLPLSKTTEQARALSKKVGSTRSGRDALTRVWGRPVKGIDTQGRQWRRWSP